MLLQNQTWKKFTVKTRHAIFMGLITITAAVAFITAVPKTRAANGENVLLGKTGLVGVAPGQFVELAAHNDFCSVPAGVRFAAVNAVSGALLGISMPIQVPPGEGVILRPNGDLGPSNRMFIQVGARLSCPASIRLDGSSKDPALIVGQQPFPAVLEIVDAVTKETIRREPFFDGSSVGHVDGGSL